MFVRLRDPRVRADQCQVKSRGANKKVRRGQRAKSQGEPAVESTRHSNNKVQQQKAGIRAVLFLPDDEQQSRLGRG